jgi:protoheme IX farnesyltransferase
MQQLLDYLSLLKPRVVLLHLLTAAAAMFLAAGGFPRLQTLAAVLAGGGLSAGAANALNCYLDRRLDRDMARTRSRPLPAERLSPAGALAFGIACGCLGLVILAFSSLAAAALALAALAFYVLVYTLWLKRSTSLSAVLSSGIGAAPPLVGWIAVTGHLAATPFLLAIIIALWTPPHFWALALARAGEYKRAGLYVLPRAHPAFWITLFTLLLLLASLALAPVAGLNPFYIAPAAALGLGFVWLALRLNTKAHNESARRLYLYSIAYLVAMFALIIASEIL